MQPLLLASADSSAANAAAGAIKPAAINSAIVLEFMWISFSF
jgi:hypothetical protein